MLLRPSTFLKQYHPDYTETEKLEQMAEEAGLIDWQQLLSVKADNHWARSRNPAQVGVPHLQPWSPVEITDTRVVIERNPYYPMVDTEGKQIPYIDRVVNDIVADMDAALVKAMSGEVDYVIDDFIRLAHMPLFLEGADRGEYGVLLAGGFNSPPLLYINQDYDYENPDSQWQQLMQDPEKRFGRAVALAIDKEDVNDSLYFGMYGMDDLITGSEYDPGEANLLLDDLGMTERDRDGFRRYPDGSPLEIVIHTHGLSPDQVDVSFMISQYLQKIGIDATARQVAPSIFDERITNNEFMMTVMWNDTPGHPSGISQDYWPGWKGGWAPASAEYMDTAGDSGREPPEYIQSFFDIHTSRKSVPPGSEEGKALYQQLTDWFAENYVMVWPVGSIVQPAILSNDLGNVPTEDGYPVIFGITEAAPQWYFK